MKASVSVCIIVKNEPLLEKCLQSIRDHVEEIVIVDTGSDDAVTVEIAKKYADIFEVYTECNDESGLIDDFSMARQKSFDLATKNWVLWMDSDDIISGAENLLKITESFGPTEDAIGIMFPYEYAYNEVGQCTCIHYRERLFFNKDKFKWVNPVHEVLVPKDGVRYLMDTREDIVWKHQRQYGLKTQENGRNLRILRKHFEKVGESDARQMYYLGLECSYHGLMEEAVQYLTRYIDISGWDDERAMAALKLVEIYMTNGDYDNGLKFGFKTIALKETWAEGYFAIGKMFYFFAQKGGPSEQRHWERCANFIKMGLSLPITKTLLFINPLDREFDIHRYLNMALSKLGDVAGALESVNAGLKSRPQDANLLANKKIFEEHIILQQAKATINNLHHIGKIDQVNADLITSIIENNVAASIVNMQTVPNTTNTLSYAVDGFPVAEQTNNTKYWNIPNVWDLNDLPVKISDEQLQSLVIMMWKQFLLYNEFDSAVSFLENAPRRVKKSFITEKILYLTKDFMETKEEDICDEREKLDIVFFAGDGVEVWTPETIKKTGMGGSELMLMHQARGLAAFGHRVRVYNSCGDMEGIYDGVEYNRTERYRDLSCDVLAVSRRADALADQFNISAGLKLLWVHDVYAICATNELLLKAHRLLALSPWHKQNLINVHNIHPDHVLLTRNGIDLSRFKKDIKRDQFKCINSSSPDRSWPILLDVWPRIKERVPEATLTLAYGFGNWEFSADRLQKELIQRLKDQIEAMKPLGVNYIGRVNQEQLAEEMLSSSVYVYPTWFSETNFISGYESQAAGLRVVTSNIAALQTTIGDRGVLIDGDWTSEEYKSKFVDSVVSALNNKNDDEREKLRQYANDNFGLDSLVHDWENMFYELLESVKTNPISPYQPTYPYRYKASSSVLEEYENSLYSYQPTIKNHRYRVPKYPNIIIGGSIINAADWEHLHKDFGVTDVINVETEHDDTEKVPAGHLLQVQIEDNGAPIPAEKVLAAIQFAKGSGKIIYIHCQMGGSRSPAFAYAVIRGVFNALPIDALSAIVEARREIHKLYPSRGFENDYGHHHVHVSYLNSVEAAING